MTVSIRTVLAILPSGNYGMDLSWSEVGTYLNATCNKQSDKDRETAHKLRDELYRDGGCEYMKTVIDAVYQDETVRALRKAWIPHSRFNNAIKRIVNEVSSVYSEPAKRTISAGQETYEAILERLQFDIVMQEVNRLFNLHYVLLAAPRVRKLTDGTREPTIDVATPSTFRPVLHPNDNTRPIGWLIRVDFRNVRTTEARKAAWVLWTDHERIHCDEQMSPIASTYVEHGFGVCPWLPVMRAPVRPDFWPGEEGADLVAGQVSIWMSNILLKKEEKSATKQAIVSGDGAGVPHAQAADTEVPNSIADGQAVNTFDMSMDLSMFRDTSDHTLEKMANNRGMSLSQMKHQGVQSADAREMMRIPLRELRREQHPTFRLFERGMVTRMSIVFEKDAEEDMRFSPDGFRIDFGEAETPMTPTEEIVLFEKERAAGLDNTVNFYMRRNPDADEDMARTAILENIEVETWRVSEMRDLQAMSGAMGTPQNGTPEPDSEDAKKAEEDQQAA